MGRSRSRGDASARPRRPGAPTSLPEGGRAESTRLHSPRGWAARAPSLRTGALSDSRPVPGLWPRLSAADFLRASTADPEGAGARASPEQSLGAMVSLEVQTSREAQRKQRRSVGARAGRGMPGPPRPPGARPPIPAGAPVPLLPTPAEGKRFHRWKPQAGGGIARGVHSAEPSAPSGSSTILGGWGRWEKAGGPRPSAQRRRGGGGGVGRARPWGPAQARRRACRINKINAPIANTKAKGSEK